MHKKLYTVLICLVFVAANFYGVYPDKAIAADYDRAFVEVFGQTSIANARSPLRTGTGGATDSWARVNSKNNQPRSSGTNPHRGTDLQAAAGTKVYPILPGKVVHVNHTITSQLGSVTLNHDIDGNGTYDNYYVKFPFNFFYFIS